MTTENLLRMAGPPCTGRAQGRAEWTDRPEARAVTCISREPGALRELFQPATKGDWVGGGIGSEDALEGESDRDRDCDRNGTGGEKSRGPLEPARAAVRRVGAARRALPRPSAGGCSLSVCLSVLVGQMLKGGPNDRRRLGLPMRCRGMGRERCEVYVRLTVLSFLKFHPARGGVAGRPWPTHESARGAKREEGNGGGTLWSTVGRPVVSRLAPAGGRRGMRTLGQDVRVA